ncbi:MAG: 30S ribosomal protein S18 [Candidatus Atribacteria bacterium]|nr:30S ribosomal protein S18 [Candidatus Atribacteria bacterium]MCK4309605.1 30S ribosomal protein S18 [Candidatus Atribacteria bacterium]
MARYRFFKRVQRRVCFFCKEKTIADYKDVELLKRFISDQGKIMPRRVTGNCAKHQRTLAIAIKRAREIGFLPYVAK